MATNPRLATMNFLNALQKISTLIHNEQKRIAKEEKNIPVLTEVVGTIWKKENQFKELKKELGDVDKKILEGIMPERWMLKTSNWKRTRKKKS